MIKKLGKGPGENILFYNPCCYVTFAPSLQVKMFS